MKNYMEKRNCGNNGCRNGVTFWNDPFDDFFKPMFYEEKFNTMKTDIKETENSYVMDVEIPGFDKKDVNVSLKDGYLTITAEKTETARIIIAHTEYAGALSPVARAVTEDFNSSAPTRSISIETIKADIYSILP